ncbi:hypothetical protein Unana1_02077 [Umbelopsis nana]
MSVNHHHEDMSAADSTAATVQPKSSKPNRRRRPRPKSQIGEVNGETSQATKADQSSPAVDDQSSSSTAPAKKPSRRRRRGGNKKNADAADSTADGDHVPQPPKVTEHPTSKPKSRFNKNRAQAQLTEDTTEVPAAAASLPSSSAPVAAPKKRNNTRRSRNQNSRISQMKEDEIKDLLTSLTHGLTTSTYDCCVQTWATKSLHEATSNLPVKNWRCPGCQYTRTVIPKEYICFCGKQLNPDYNKYITPHSCGQLCGSKRDCPHECVL